MFDWLIRLLGGIPEPDYIDLVYALQDIAELKTPNAAHGVKRAVKIAEEALGVEN